MYVNDDINSTNFPQIELAFYIKDLKLIEKIQERLGGGIIYIRPNGQSGTLKIKKQSVLLHLINLINGHMRTPKIEALHRLINWINLKTNNTIPLLGIDKTPITDNS